MIPLFNLGFRPFFLGAGIFSVLSMLAWAGTYSFGWELTTAPGIAAVSWHAHEMLYGYTLAVVSGFLLTAVKNWTGIQTASGWRLLFLFSLWALARIAAMTDLPAAFMFILDGLFILLLVLAAGMPVVRAKQWQQTAVISKVIVLGLGNVLFYAGVLGWIDKGIPWGIYSGLYLIISLILLLGRRVIPFFIERGVGYEVKLVNRRWLDISAMVLFLLFFIFEVFTDLKMIAAHLALILFIMHTVRLAGWHTRGIWKKPLLWSLFIAYTFIISGFLLKACGYYFNLYPFLAVHAFAFGGVGLVTLSMMSRVALGHTGRNIHQPPKAMIWAFVCLIAGAVSRVFLPLIYMENYAVWVALSQILWIAAFSLFVIIYFPILTRPRIDGQPG